MATRHILGIGGAHIDRRGQVYDDFIPGASNPGAMSEDVGGGAFNALRNACALGVSGAMLSVRGGDDAGNTVARAIAAAGIEDLSVTFLDRRTPSYTAILSSDGDVVAALADMELYEIAFPRQMRRASLREAVGRADAILTDANLPEAALPKLPALAGARPLFAIAISPAKAVRLGSILPALSCLFLNTREAAALTGIPAASAVAQARALAEMGLARAVLSRGAEPAILLDESRLLALTPPPVELIRDVTGAGDALAGGAIAALLSGATFVDAVRHGVAAARLALESASAVPEFGPAEFSAILSTIGEAVPVAAASPGKDTHAA